ncbi:Exportin-6 [Mortierella sp. GBA43]|nr:Exportin-6 [Mortierella sp. GBA43]
MDVLEQLLAEYFGPTTSTERKRAIEAQLDAQRLTLEDCRYMLTNAQSDYLAWFAASQYQKRIQAEWTRLDPEVQHAHRSFLLHFLQQHFGQGPGTGSGAAGSSLSAEIGASMRMGSAGSGAASATTSGPSGSTFHFSTFVLNKVVQLITDIALLDWPDRFQDLLPEIHRLLQSKNKSHVLLGWTLLEATVQEFVAMYPAPGNGTSHRSHLTLSKQKWYLWENFKAQIPDLLVLIVQHLDHCYGKMLVTPLSTEAPAPSPVEHSIWGSSYFSRRPSTVQQHVASPLMHMNNSIPHSFSGLKSVPGSVNGSYSTANHSESMMGESSAYENGQRQGGQGDQGMSHSFGKSPTTTLRKTLSQALGGPNSPSGESGPQMGMMQSPASPGLSLLQARHRMGSISDLGQIAMRRSSINAAMMMDSRRNSVDSTFISGNRMDSDSRKSCILALKALTTLLACPGLDPRQTSFASSITTVLKFTTLHQNKTVDLGILALSCLNGLVARPGFLATNQETMTGAVRVMADLIRYFNEVKDGIDDIDESYLQMFMHFVSLFCTLGNLERAEKTIGLSKPEFLTSFARFTLEKASVDYLKTCMDVWKSLLDAMIHMASETPRPIPAGDPLRRLQEPLLYFMSALVEKFYKMKGATRSEEAFSTFEVEDEEDLEDLTDLVESFVGLVAEVFTEEVIEMLLPVTLGILSRVAYNFDQNFEDRREYTSNLMIHLTRMTKVSIDFYVMAASDPTTPGKSQVDLTGTVRLLPASCSGTPSQAPTRSNTFLGPASPACSIIDRKLLLTCVKTLGALTQHIRIPPTLLSTGEFLFWELESIREMASCLSQIVTVDNSVMGTEFVTLSKSTGGEDEERQGITPDDELYLQAYLALSNGITLDPKSGPELQAAALQAFGSLVAPIVYPLQSVLQDAKSGSTAFLSNNEGMCLVILRTLISSVEEASVACRTMVYEGLKVSLPIVQEFFDIYLEDHDISMDILAFFKALVKSLYRPVGSSQCLEIARGLMERMGNPSLLDTALASRHDGDQQSYAKSLHHQPHALQQRKVVQRIQMSVSILKTVLELPFKEVAQSLGDFMMFLFSQLGPKLLGVRNQHETGSVESTGTQDGHLHSRMQAPDQSGQGKGLENGVYDLMGLFFATIKVLLSQHYRHFFTGSISGGPVGSLPINGGGGGGGGVDEETHNRRAQMLQSCMEYLARGLHRPEPDMVRQSIETLVGLQEHSLCRLFERPEFQTIYRFEFLQILLRLALRREQDLLLEDIAGLIHKMVKSNTSSSSGSDQDEKFLSIWHGDLKRFVAGLEPSQVTLTLSSSSSSSSPSSSPSQGLAQMQFPDSAKETLWMDLLHLGDGTMYREGLYQFVNDAQVYAQSLLS